MRHPYPTMLRLLIALLLAAFPAAAQDSSSPDEAEARAYMPELKAGAKPYEWKTVLSSPERVLLLGPAIPTCPANRDELLSIIPELKAAGYTHVLLGERLAPGWVESRPFEPVAELGGDGLEPLREALRGAGLLVLRGSAGLPVSLSTSAARPDPGSPLKEGESPLPEPRVVEDSLDCFSSLSLEERWLAGLARLLKEQPKAKVAVLFGTDGRLQDAFQDVLSLVHDLPAKSYRLLRPVDRPYAGALSLAGLEGRRVSFEPISRREDPAPFLNVPGASQERCLTAADEHPGYARSYSNYACRQDPEAFRRIQDFSNEVFQRSSETAAGLAHLSGHLGKTLSWGGTKICFCKTPGSLGLSHMFGTLILDHKFRAGPAVPEAAGAFWHELQHGYDEMSGRKKWSYSLASEERAWEAGCLVRSKAAELGMGKEPQEGTPCSRGFPRGHFCGITESAAEEVLKLEKGGAARLERACAEFERSEKGNPLSLEGLRFEWTVEDCLRRAKAKTSAPGWESAESYCEWCDPKKGGACAAGRAKAAPKTRP